MEGEAETNGHKSSPDKDHTDVISKADNFWTELPYLSMKSLEAF
jgi:hypothetical protein